MYNKAEMYESFSFYKEENGFNFFEDLNNEEKKDFLKDYKKFKKNEEELKKIIFENNFGSFLKKKYNDNLSVENVREIFDFNSAIKKEIIEIDEDNKKFLKERDKRIEANKEIKKYNEAEREREIQYEEEHYSENERIRLENEMIEKENDIRKQEWENELGDLRTKMDIAETEMNDVKRRKDNASYGTGYYDSLSRTYNSKCNIYIKLIKIDIMN